MSAYTQAEKSRLLLYKVAKGNPQAIIAAIDEVRRLADEALKGTLDTSSRKALELLAKRIDEVERAYQKRLDEAIKSLRPLIEAEVKKIEPRKGEKGDKGDKPTEAELLLLIEPLIPFVKDGEDGKTPDKEALIAMFKPVLAEMIANAQPTIEEKAEAEKNKKDTIEALVDKVVADRITKIKHPGGGVSGDRVVAGDGVTIASDALGRKQISASGSFSILSPTGDVDDSNTDFVFTQKPTLVNINGTFYRENNGWAWDGTDTVTLDFPAGEGGDVYGIV